MKKYILCLCIGLMMFSCNESDKPEVNVDQIKDAWLTTPIKKVKSADVLGMVQAFQKQWPTRMGRELFEDLKLPEDEKQFVTEVDKENGFVSYWDGREDPDSERMEARVWPRSNGHQLFGINLFEPNTEHQSLLAFYDYDPATKTLTPESNPAVEFVSDYPDGEVWYECYPENSDFVVYEYFGNWYGALRHVYPWDGMNFGEPETEFEGISTIMDEYKDSYEVYEMEDFDKYALIDIDKDGQPELWLSTNDEENQVVCSIVEGEVVLLAGQDYKRHLMFYDGVVGDAGGCGTGCYYSHYVKLNNSAPEFTFGDMQLFNFRTDDMDHEYSKGEELLTQQEGEDMLDSFGDLVEPEVKWFPWKH